MRRNRTTIPLLAAGVFAVAWLLYANTLGNDFVWDDRTLVVENTDLRTLDGETIERLLTTHYWDMTGKAGGLYRPLSALSFYLDYQLYGKNPQGYHAANATLNASVCVLVFLLVYLLFANVELAVVTSLLFASLPLHTENVAWIAGRTDLIATFYMLLSLLAYAWWRARGAWMGFVLAALAFILALLAKEFALVLPPLIVVLEIGSFAPLKRWRGGLDRKRWATVVVTFFGLSACYFAARKAVLGHSVQSFEPFATGFVETLALSTSIFAHYVYKLVFPFVLNAEWEAPTPTGLLNVHSLAGIAMLAVIAYAIRRYHRHGEVVLAIAVFVIGIAPVLNLFPVTEVSAERFLYFPSLGFCLLVALGLTYALKRRRNLAVAAAVVLVVAYGARTVARNADWRDETTLFAKTVADAADNARAHLNLGNVHYRAGRHRQALAEYERALAIDPEYARAWSSSAGAYKALGELDGAFRCMERALEIEPTNANFHNSVGVLHIQRRRLDLAVAAFRLALQYQPEHDRARFNLGLALFRQEDYAGAVAAFTALAHKDIDFVHAFYYLAVAELRLGNVARAREHAERFLSLYHEADGFRRGAQAVLAGRDPGANDER